MKTKQAKEEQDKSLDEETIIEPKTRARKKASDIIDEEKNKPSQDEPKPSKETKKAQPKPKAIVKKRPLGIRKALRSKKAAVVKEKVKKVIKNTRGRKVAIKTEPDSSQDKEAVPLIPAADIKKEPVEDNTPNSRSSSPKTAGRRQRLSSDIIMMKSMLSDSPSSLVLGPRTSPYSMRSERSNSPLLVEGKNLRSGKPRKVKTNLLSEVVIKEQKKRRRLLSDSKNPDAGESADDCKKLKRGRSCSRDGSEISKCSDNTESDLSLSETLNDSDNRELNKKLDKTKTDLDVDIENNIQISTVDKVPSLNVDSKLAESKLDPETSSIVNEKNKKLSLKRSTSLDSDNNNSNKVKVDTINASDIEEKLLLKTENDTLFEARSSILTSMSKTFNSKEIAKNMRKARRGRKAAAEGRRSTSVAKTTITSTITNEPIDDKNETIETLSKDIDDLIKNLDQNIDGDRHAETTVTTVKTTENLPEQTEARSAVKFYGLTKPLNPVDDNSVTPETPVKNKDSVISVTNENTPSKTDESDSIKLHYEEDSVDKTENSRSEITYKSTVASIDKLMDRLKEFEEFDKRRQRQESETKTVDNKPMMVTNDVVLITKSGADIKPLKDIQSVRSPERPIEKENVLSCFENNSAISIVKRDQVRKSIDVDLPSSVTLIKRNSFSARKESTSSNHSRESDAISIFEKSLGKDVTLTEIRKSVDKSATPTQVDIHQFATLHPNSSNQNVVLLDSSQISITPRIPEAKMSGNDVQIISKRKSRESMSRKSSESTNDTEEKLATIEKIKSPTHHSPAISIIPAPVVISSSAVSTTPITITPTSLAILPTAIVTTPASGSIISPVAVVPTPLAITTPVATASTPLAIAAAPIAITPTPVVVTPASAVVTPVPVAIIPAPVAVTPAPIAVTPAPVTVTLASVAVTNAPVAVTSPEAVISPVETPVETEALPPPKEDIKPVTVVPNISEIPETDQNGKTPDTIVDKITKVEEPITEDVETLKTAKTEDPGKMEVGDTTEEISKDTVEKEITPKEEPKASASTEVPTRGPGRPPKPRISIEAQPGPSNALNETPESQKRKENVLRTLGLLTHKAAKEAKIEKLKEKERIYANNKGKTAKSGDYTGTLKTVIKLNRSGGDREKKKHRSSLKMTFQKSKYRAGKPVPEMGEAAAEDDTFYTIERREAAGSATAEGGQRKSHYSNRLNNYEGEAVPEPTEPKETLNLVIPEKASSFSIHPGRLCMDQCFYCGGKFGLFDTPCHIAQIKSSERQKKVLDNEEKLTIDSCLCDACYRHVDRRANCPSYRKRPLPASTGPEAPSTTQPDTTQDKTKTSEKPPSPALEEESSDETGAGSSGAAPCHVEGCLSRATHSIRRKWLIKMRTSVNRVLKLRTDYPGLHTLPLCAEHHRSLAPLMCCLMCRRRLTKHHNLHFIHHGYLELNPILESLSVPVRFVERPVLCKACRYYCTLLQRPGHNDGYASGYRRKLLQIYNIELPPEPEDQPETEPMQTNQDDAQNNQAILGQTKKKRNKSKQRKSTEPDTNSETSEQTNESTPEKDQKKEDMKPLEEDIESLISSNKILVPSAVKPTEATPSDGSENEGVYDMEPPHHHVDKQTELQYLLQKQNNPAQFLHNAPNLTQKQRNLLKMQTLSGIHKTGQQHRINEKNAKRIHKLGQMMIQKEKVKGIEDEMDGIPVLKNITLNEECTIESIPNKRPADINTLKNKWQMTESFTQVKKNLSELSKKLTVEKEPKKLNDAKYSNPVKRLETNPSISVRELFPGEEEMNLQCNIEFNNVKGVTPEGWEKCNSTVQYDVETKKLWSELQRPYGNQSSFLRHLVILEKYFRSGDLVLSHTASPTAANYSDSVQNRLRAYDNIPCERPVSLVEFRKKPSINGKSLLKSNHTEDKEARKFKPPAPITGKVKKDKSKSKQLPPELIAINTPNAQGRKAIQNVLHNIQQLVKGVSASDPTEVAAAPLPPPKFDAPKEKPEKKSEKKEKSPEKGKNSSKPWRPTLMPITEENLRKIAREPLEKAVDGRLLPKLVIVMSSGKRYHITLQDYNKMCVMRREKLQQLEDGKKKRPSIDETTVITELQPSTLLGNGGMLVQNITEDKDKKDDLISSNAATILKNVGLKNITIAPIPAKTATITSQTLPAPTVSSPSLLVTSTPIKIPQLGPAVSITSETVLTPNLPIMTTQMIMPKIPKSLTVIPQTVVTSIPQNVVVATAAQQVNPDVRP